MLGSALLVAPVVVQGAKTREVYLPSGPDAWFDFYSGKRFKAGQTHTIAAPLDVLPLFAPSGMSIPIAAGKNGRHRHDDPVSEQLEFS